MAKAINAPAKAGVPKERKKTSPFKDYADFEKEITDFANKYKTIVATQAKRTSDYFEMSCYNYIVKFYELKGYEVTPQNLQNGQYRYKCTPSGIQSNFSNFEAVIKNGKKETIFEIQHNLAVQSSHDGNIYTTPDICVIAKNSVQYTKEYYETKTTFSFVKNEKMITFCEVKQFAPFPELLFNFIGVLNELMKEYMINEGEEDIPPHIAPSLMLSGKANKQTNRIKDSLEKRYCVNIFYDLFYSGAYTFSKANIDDIRCTGKIPDN